VIPATLALAWIVGVGCIFSMPKLSIDNTICFVNHKLKIGSASKDIVTVKISYGNNIQRRLQKNKTSNLQNRLLPILFNHSVITPKCETLPDCRERFVLVLVRIFREIFMRKLRDI